MHHFEYKNNELYCEGVPVRLIVEKAGTPVYIYSYNTMFRHYNAFAQAFSSIPHIICYSVKANSNISVIGSFLRMGSGLDIVSKGELYRATIAGADPQKIVFSGVGKKEDEIKFALEKNILMFNVESEAELYKINAVAGCLNKKAPVALRVNPDIDPQTHPYISTGMKENKFGINIDKAEELYSVAQKMNYIDIVGIDFHIGSQLTKMEPFTDALDKLKTLVEKLRHNSIGIKYIDIGGGLGITYDKETPPKPEEYAGHIKKSIKDLNCTLIVEPGRALVGNAGILVASVIYLKQNEYKNFIIVDASMTDLIRPALYSSYQNVIPVVKTDNETITADIVGPVCESSDFMAKNRSIVKPEPNDLIAVMSCGAYGFSMASNYNSRPRAAEIMVKENEFTIIRNRETLEELIQNEKLVEF